MNTAKLQGECAVLISQNLKNPGTMKIDYSKKPLIKNGGIVWESSVKSDGSGFQNFHCSNDGETVRVKFD